MLLWLTNPGGIDYVLKKNAPDFAEGFADQSDPACQIHYAIKNLRITKSEIFIDHNQPELKQKICAIVQVSRALGLANKGSFTFEQFWRKISLDSNFLNAEAVENFRQHSALFQHIHMCSDLHAGMTFDQVKEILQTSNRCLDLLQ